MLHDNLFRWLFAENRAWVRHKAVNHDNKEHGQENDKIYENLFNEQEVKDEIWSPQTRTTKKVFYCF